MSQRISLILADESIDFSVLQAAWNNFAVVLEELDQALSGGRSVHWIIAGLKRSSALVELVPVHRVGELFDKGGPIIDACVEGFESLIEQPVRPPHFSDRALSSARKLARIAGDRTAGVVLVGSTGRNQRPKRIPVSSRIVTNIDEIIGVSKQALGTIEGRLETVSIHDGLAFTIYDPLRSRGARCICPPDLFGELKHALGARLLVYGRINYNKAGDPISIHVERIEYLRERDELPQAADIRGLLSDDPIDTEILSDLLRE